MQSNILPKLIRPVKVKNVDMMYALYQCYQQDKEEQQALDMLLAICR